MNRFPFKFFHIYGLRCVQLCVFLCNGGARISVRGEDSLVYGPSLTPGCI